MILLRFPFLTKPENSVAMPRLISIFLIIVSLGGLAFASDWKREVNGRWGFALTYPASLIPEPLRRWPALSLSRSDSLSCGDWQPHASRRVFGRFLPERTEHQRRNGDHKFKKENYCVISGVNPNGYEFYHKVFFYPTYWLEFEITYPHAQHAVYDAWVERIAHDFVPALPDNGQYDR